MLRRLAARHNPDSEKGAAAVEWALLLSLIAVVVIAFTTGGHDNTKPQSTSTTIANIPDSCSIANPLGCQSPPVTTTVTLPQTGTGFSTSDTRLPDFACPGYYFDKALDALNEALTKNGKGQAEIANQLSLAQTYLAFAQAAETHLPTACPPNPQG